MMEERKGLTLNVSMTDTAIFSGMIGLLSRFLRDEKIPAEVRLGYEEEIIDIVEASGYVLEDNTTERK